MEDPRRRKLVGSWLTLPTFNDENYNLLLNRHRIHIRWLIENRYKEGAGVLMIAGGNGEGTFLDEDEWRSLAEVLAEVAVGKVPTCVGVYELSARAAARKAKYAADLGIDFIQLPPPHYLPPSDDDVFGYYKYVNDASDIGIVAYNLPWCIPDGYEFTQPLFERFATLENIVGIKWGCVSIWHWAMMIRLFKHRFNFIEQGGLLSVGFRLGMVGFTDGLGAVAPRLSFKKWELIREKRFDELDEMEIARLDAQVADSRLQKTGQPGATSSNVSRSHYSGMGEGPPSRGQIRALGMEPGPVFPYQEPVSDHWIQNNRRIVEAMGLKEWVDWDPSLFDEIESTPAAAGAPAD